MSRSPLRRLGLEPLEARDVPAFLPGATVIAAGDAGGPPVVRLLDPDSGDVRSQFLVYEATFTGGVRVAVGDVNADGFPDLITGAGAGGGPAIKVYDGLTGNTLSAFFAYAPDFTGGVSVAAGDVDGDGRAEVIVGAGAGGGPHVQVFDGLTGTAESSFFAYESSFRGGVFVAAGDTDGDGLAEVVTGTGVGGGPAIKVFDLAGGRAVSTAGFFAYDSSFRGGVLVAAGDVTGDGRAEIVAGTGPGGGPQVGVFTPAGRTLGTFFAYDDDFRSGVNVGAADLTGDGIAELLTGAGPGGGAQVNVYSFPDDDPIESLTGLPDGVAGVQVAGTAVPLNLPGVSDGVINDAYGQAAAVVAAQAAAAQAAFLAAQPQVVLVPYPVGGLGGLGGLGGIGYGLGGYGLGGSPFFGSPVYGNSYLVDPYYVDPFYGAAVDPGFYDPGYYYDPGFYDPGYYYDPGFYDPGYYYDPGFGGGFFGGEGF